MGTPQPDFAVIRHIGRELSEKLGRTRGRRYFVRLVGPDFGGGAAVHFEPWNGTRADLDRIANEAVSVGAQSAHLYATHIAIEPIHHPQQDISELLLRA